MGQLFCSVELISGYLVNTRLSEDTIRPALLVWLKEFHFKATVSKHHHIVFNIYQNLIDKKK